MNQGQTGAVYRICAVSDERWDVLRGSSSEPVATFHDKHAALAYAMSLARTRPVGVSLSGRYPFGRGQNAQRSVFDQPRIHE